MHNRVKRLLKGDAVCKNCIFFSKEFSHCTNSEYIREATKNSIFSPTTVSVTEGHSCKEFMAMEDLSPRLVKEYEEFIEQKDKYNRKTFN